MTHQHTHKGMAMIYVVIMLGFASLVMILNTSLLGIGALDIATTIRDDAATFALTDGCAENALERLRFSSSYTGETLSLDSGQCIISAQESGGVYTIKVHGTNDDVATYIEILATRSSDGDVVVTSWERK